MSNLFATQFLNTSAIAQNAHGNAGVQEAARQSLQQIVDTGIERSSATIQKILTEIPEDRITQASAMGLWVTPGTLNVATNKSSDASNKRVHDHALSQLCTRVGVPTQYARELINAPAPEGDSDASGMRPYQAWQHSLAEDILREHASHTSNRMLVRSHGDTHRAFLSDKYRRLDSRPLLEAFVKECQAVGAIPVEGISSDIKCSVRAIIPRVIEPVPGEYMVMGLNWQNSDYGSGAYAVSFFAMRLLCNNGMVGESNIKQIHLGGRLPENLKLSERTYNMDTQTMASATQDVVKSLLSDNAVADRVAIIAKAASKETTFDSAFRKVRNSLNKGEAKAVKEAFESKEEILLPAGKTNWRFSNALSWVANQVEAPERKIELQNLAGKVAAA